MTFRSDFATGTKHIQAHMSTDFIDDITGFQAGREGLLFFQLPEPQPITMRCRVREPALAARGASHDANHCARRNQPERKPNGFPKSGLVRYQGGVHKCPY